MSYVTSIERLAHQEGFEEGQESTVLRQLKRKFGELDREVKAQIQKLGSTQLEDLSEALLDFSSVEDLTAWLRNLNH
ncbi:MAG: DUF4351 domain-containing protein [Xenococcaceae cyanobacterium]